MGAGNAALVLSRWGNALAGIPFRVAMQMALSTVDRDAAPHYWGGWAKLADAAGKTYPAECAPHDGISGCRGCQGCRAARRCVDRALKSLQDAGFCSLASRPKPRRNAEYALNLWGHLSIQCTTEPSTETVVHSDCGQPVDDGGLHHAAERQTVVHMHHGLGVECTTVPVTNAPRSRAGLCGAKRTQEEEEHNQEDNSSESPPHVPAPRPSPEIVSASAELDQQRKALDEWIRNHPEEK